MTGRLATMLVVAAVAAAAGLGIGAAVWAGDDHGGGANSSSMVGHGSGAATGPLDDRAFHQQMVPHHESAIAMASLALARTERPEIRRLAEGIVAAQEREIADMRDRHREWFGEELIPSTSGPHAAVDMVDLETAVGDDFDRVFLRMMIPHHASAITMAESVLMGSRREETRALAEGITAAQAKEIGQMQRQREQWFPPLG